MLALILMYVGFTWFDVNVGGLFSPEYAEAPWSWAQVWRPDRAPADARRSILGSRGTAQLIRIMRANLLDELRKPYVVTARAKGSPEYRVIMKYPGARRAQPVRQHHRLPASLRRLRQHHRLAGAEPADRRPAAPAAR